MKIRFVAVYSSGFENRMTGLILGGTGDGAWTHESLARAYGVENLPLYAGTFAIGENYVYAICESGAAEFGIAPNQDQDQKVVEKLKVLRYLENLLISLNANFLDDKVEHAMLRLK